MSVQKYYKKLRVSIFLIGAVLGFSLTQGVFAQGIIQHCEGKDTTHNENNERMIYNSTPIFIKGYSCKDLGIVAREYDLSSSALDKKIRPDALKNGKFYINDIGIPLQYYSSPGSVGGMIAHSGKTGNFRDSFNSTNYKTWNGSGEPMEMRPVNGGYVTRGACKEGEGYYYLFFQGQRVKDLYDPNGDSPDCPVTGYIFSCDSDGTPGTPGYKGACKVSDPCKDKNGVMTTTTINRNPSSGFNLSNCGNGQLDPGECCDLGANNNDDGSTGCLKNCLIAPTWECSK